ncbi:Glycoprotein-N-acetylgalactosamine 3-beta-galactosyltransferase 1 [Holothuria leucospilota]|uniref:N-acetylgalactosaminide beta-1,3-galactosyltransferase n=1 Tax=Holothuria leucospilota TaxID=206669 RepID=A0A9Q1BGL8_HOLLE|nr:Glycoprotein-N-acetylgalactosamine 3-beta-galactosyltransferase 1 [Holothuria leucospilota]
MACRRILANSSNIRQHFIKFLLGVFLGSVITHIGSKHSRIDANFYLKDYLQKGNYSSTPVTNANRVSRHNYEDGELQHREIAVLGEDDLSNWMSSRIRILCWIMTSPATLQEKATHVKATWARRCNIVLFISSENTSFPTVAVSDHEGRKYLWKKTSGAFDYIYKHYLDKADWFLKADDDTYVIVENLRKLLSTYNSEKAIYFGRKYKFPHNTKVIYMQGGAGYVLSRKAVELLVGKIFKSDFYASYINHLPSEDIMISKLLMKEKVKEGYSRDGIHEKFHAVSPEETIVPIKHVLTNFSFYPVKQGPECCSDYTISFHYVTPDMMHWLEYMVYHLRPFGVGYHACPADIRRIVGLPEVPADGSANEIEGQNITNEETKEEMLENKSEEKQKSKKIRAPSKRGKKEEKVNADVNRKESPGKKVGNNRNQNKRRRKWEQVKGRNEKSR